MGVVRQTISIINMKIAFLLGVVCLLFLWDFGNCSPINCHDITVHFHTNYEDISVELAERCGGRASREEGDDDDDDDDDYDYDYFTLQATKCTRGYVWRGNRCVKKILRMNKEKRIGIICICIQYSAILFCCLFMFQIRYIDTMKLYHVSILRSVPINQHYNEI